MEPTKKLILSIGIPAYNEEANILNLIQRILDQTRENYELKEIVINSDGSSDNTVEQVLKANNPIVRVLDNKDRIGKIKRINQLINELTGDVIALIDADVVPTTLDTFDKLIKPFIDSDVVYVSGKPIPLSPTTFIEHAAVYSRSVWDKIRKEFKNGNSIYTCHGTLYAFRSEFAKENNFPDTIWADIGFHYLVCRNKNLKYKSAPDANAYFRAPQTIKDYLNQIARYKKEDQALFDYFGTNIKTEYDIPVSMVNRYKLEALIAHPLHILAIFILNSYSNFANKLTNNNAKAGWAVINSTNAVINEK